ncbi:hypothetical protein NFI96_025386, partial [Prochilodus magdalenae]
VNLLVSSVDPASEKMNGAAFPSPTAEMAEMNRIHYELEYTEGISQRMRIPEMLKVAPFGGEEQDGTTAQEALHTAMMQVPDRIVVAGDAEDNQFTRPRDLDLIQSTPLETLSLQTPPRVLTLNERPLDFLELERPSAQASEEVRSQNRSRRERSISENTAVRHNGQLARNDSLVTPSPPSALRAVSTLAEDGQGLSSARGVLSFIQSTTRRAYQQVLEVLDENQRSKPSLRGGSTSSNLQHENRFALASLDTTVEGGVDDMAVVDATALRRQIIKLNRRLQLLEEENKERAKREMIMSNMAACWTLMNRGALLLGYRNVCRNVLLSQTREKKRWMKAYTLIMERKKRIEGEPAPKPRSQQPNWDYHAEVEAFSARLKESISLELLKTAFVNPCYLRSEQERRRTLGLDGEAAALNLRDNKELRDHGQQFTLGFLKDWCRSNFPHLPEPGVTAIVGHLTGYGVMCHVARNLAVEDLAMTAEFPVPEDVLQGTFFAVIGALEQSSGAERARLFVRDFLVTQLIGKDLFDMWKVVNPMGLLVEELTRRGVALPEPRLIQSAGASTVLPLYFVGLYSDRKLLAQGPGETVLAAEEEAARVALRKLFGYTENRKPFDFSTPQEQSQTAASRAVTSG